MTLGFLLARDQAGEWTILDNGPAAEIRQKYKALLTTDDESTELFYASMRGEVKRKVFKKRILEAQEDFEPYTGEGEDPQPAKKQTRRRK